MDGIVVTFKVKKELLDRIDALAFKLRVTRSELIRNAITEYLQKHEDIVRKQITVKRYVLR